eukprot:4170099-Pleurochrysis_carterae.AAC.1
MHRQSVRLKAKEAPQTHAGKRRTTRRQSQLLDLGITSSSQPPTQTATERSFAPSAASKGVSYMGQAVSYAYAGALVGGGGEGVSFLYSGALR